MFAVRFAISFFPVLFVTFVEILYIKSIYRFARKIFIRIYNIFNYADNIYFSAPYTKMGYTEIK